MELNLQPRSAACFVSHRPFAEGDRVVSFLVRTVSGEIVRRDVLEAETGGFAPDGFVACRWIQIHQQRLQEENPERALKLTTETLFLTLVDPSTEATPESARLIRFLALMLERKRVLRPRGRTLDGARDIYEHAKTRQFHEIAAVELDAAFFNAVQSQLSVLVGEPARRTPPETVSPAAP